MDNPFDVETGGFLVLVNVEGQHSLWPAFHELQNGWPVAAGPAMRQASGLDRKSMDSHATQIACRRATRLEAMRPQPLCES